MSWNLVCNFIKCHLIRKAPLMMLNCLANSGEKRIIMWSALRLQVESQIHLGLEKAAQWWSGTKHVSHVPPPLTFWRVGCVIVCSIWISNPVISYMHLIVLCYGSTCISHTQCDRQTRIYRHRNVITVLANKSTHAKQYQSSSILQDVAFPYFLTCLHDRMTCIAMLLK